MDLTTFVSRILTRCPELPRTVWTPEPCDPGQTTRPSILASKFGGTRPYIPKGRSWPECHAHMSFICQLNMSDLPEELTDRLGVKDGLFQCFVCPELCCSDATFDSVFFLNQSEIGPSSLEVLCASQIIASELDRSQLPANLQSLVDDLEPELISTYEEVIIEDWDENERKDIPQLKELGFMADVLRRLEATQEEVWDLELTESDLDDCFDSDSDSDSDSDEDAAPSAEAANDQVVTAHPKICRPYRGLKLGGYFHFYQDMEYPTCPECKLTMDVTFMQLVPDPALEIYDWADAGGYITLCPDCKRPAFYWQT